jgi:hypothetical protein
MGYYSVISRAEKYRFMKLPIIALFASILLSFNAFSQTDGVLIDPTNTQTRNNSAALEVFSTTQGFLPPRLTNAQRNAIVAPATGLVIFNTNSNCVEMFSGAWQSIYCACPNLPALNSIIGNTPVCAGTNQTYTVPSITGASTYNWTVTGGPVITGNTTNSISFNAPNLSTYTVSVTATNACNTSSVVQSTVVNCYTAVPPTPVFSSSPSAICANNSYSYTIANGLGNNGTGAITYTWTITATGSAQATLTANSLTASAGTPVTYTAASTGITLNMGAGAGNITVTVVGNNTCGTTVTPLSSALAINTQSANPTSASASPATICNGSSSTLTLTGGGGGTGQVIRWYTSSCGGTLVGTGNSLAVSPTVTTTYYGRYENPAPCNYNTTCQTATVTVNQPSVAPSSITGTTPICNGGSTLLTATGGSLGTGANYQWGTGAVVGTSPLVGQTASTLTVSPTSTTTYWVRVENTTAPCAATTGGATRVITVNQPSVAPTSITGTSTICNGGSTTLTAIGGTLGTGANYQWGTGATIGSSPLVGQTSSTLSISPTATTTYWVRIENTSAPCAATTSGASQVVTVNQPSVAPTGITGTTTICVGSSTTLTATGGTLGTGANYQWGTGAVVGTSPLVGQTGSSVIVTPGSTTTYWVRIENTSSPCTATTGGVSQVVTVNTLSVAPTSITGTTTICNGSSTTLTVSGGSAGTGATAQWYTGSCGGPSAGSGNSINVSPTSNTTYYVAYSGTCNTTTCVNTTVTVNTLSVAPTGISGTTTICNGTSTALTISGGSAGTGASVQWFTGSCGGTSAGTGNSITVSPTSTTTYFVRYSGTCNTTACASQAVTVTQIPANPGVGNATWNVTAYNGGNIDLTGTYYGYYTESSLSYNTTTRWGSGGSPSEASGWQGCVVPADGHVVVSRRTNFTCGYYQIDVPAHDDDARVYINGTLVWSHEPGCCDNHTNIWTGYLSAASTVEMRHLEGGGGSNQALTITSVGTSTSVAPSSISGATTIYTCQTNSTTLTQVGGTLASGASYQWYSSSCGVTSVGTGNSITVTPGANTTYYVRAEGTCNTTACASTTVSLNASYPDPGFGNNTWNAVVYNGGNIDLSGVRSGYYVESALSYNSLNRWCTTCSPSEASGYVGCAVGVDNHVVVSRRQGFPTAFYQLDMPNHDDDVRVYINGVQVFEHIGCCDVHTNIWTGYLNASSTIEVRNLEGGGGSHQSLTLTVMPQNVTFNFTGAAQAWTVPNGVNTITIDARGAQGYGGGYGGRTVSSHSVTAGQVLNVYVGGAGGSTGGGYNGGGNAGTGNTVNNAGGGGGASDVRTTPYGLGNRINVAGGGGGVGGWAGGSGGSAGAPNGSNGGSGQGGGGGGATQASGGGGGGGNGVGAGGAGSSGQGGNGSSGNAAGGGGGGGGYFGGGGGGGDNDTCCADGGGGGGGSSWSNGSSITYTSGYQGGNGSVIISW